MLNKEIDTFEEHLLALKHYKALKYDTVHLDRDAPDLPWDRVTKVSTGGTHRLDMETTLRFEYAHPDGVTFSWWTDVELRGANGTGSYQIEVARLAHILAVLPSHSAEQLREYLATSAEAVQAKGDEYMTIAQRQYGDAEALRGIARAVPESEPVDA